MKVPADQLQRVLRITDLNYLVSGGSLAVIDSPLGTQTPSSAGSGGSTRVVNSTLARTAKERVVNN
jgi:hypothetical protein